MTSLYFDLWYNVISEIPEFEDVPYVELNGNVPLDLRYKLSEKNLGEKHVIKRFIKKTKYRE